MESQDVLPDFFISKESVYLPKHRTSNLEHRNT
jgi:hypothetical protein